MISVNPYTSNKYIIPPILDDKEKISDFIIKNKNKKVVVVQGLGFVGSVMSIICANSKKGNYAVIGIDLPNKNNFWKIESINTGEFPVSSSDPKIEKLYKNSILKKNFLATYDTYAYSLADIIIVDINLDVEKKSDKNGKLISYDVDLKNFRKGIESIGKNCKKDALVLVETTVPPGTTKKVVYNILKKSLLKRNLPINKIKVGHSYERVMPGPNYVDSIINFYRVYSGINKASEIEVKKFLKTIISTKKYPLTKLNNTNATEIAKVLENSYRAMNIAFIIEWTKFAELSKVNLYEVINAIKMRPTHNNMMFPGIGVGGYCLTKDPLLASWSYINHFKGNNDLKFSLEGVRENDLMPLNAFRFFLKKFKIKSLLNKKILILGISYRGDVGDTRYSPVNKLYEFLKSKNSKIYLHDPFVSFWEEFKINTEKIDDILKNKINYIIICSNHSLYNEKYFINKINKKKNIKILDCNGFLNKKNIKKLTKLNKVKVIGRGDL